MVRALRDYKRLEPPGRYNNPKYIRSKQERLKIYKTK